MKKRKNNFFWRSLVFFLLLNISCKPQNMRYTYLEKDDQQFSEKLLLLNSYDEPKYTKVILINEDNGKQIYQSDNFITGEHKIIELEIEKSVKYIKIKYNNKRFNIKMDKAYKFIYIEFKNREFLEIVYTNKKPVFT